MHNTMYKFTGATICVAAISLTGCTGSGVFSGHQTQVQWQANGMPRHEDPSRNWWHYQFVYHPKAQVYFEPYTQTYYWNDNGAWKNGYELPSHITLEPHLAKVVRLNTETPHFHHDTAVALNNVRPWEPARAPSGTEWDQGDTRFAWDAWNRQNDQKAINSGVSSNDMPSSNAWPEVADDSVSANDDWSADDMVDGFTSSVLDADDDMSFSSSAGDSSNNGEGWSSADERISDSSAVTLEFSSIDSSATDSSSNGEVDQLASGSDSMQQRADEMFEWESQDASADVVDISDVDGVSGAATADSSAVVEVEPSGVFPAETTVSTGPSVSSTPSQADRIEIAADPTVAMKPITFIDISALPAGSPEPIEVVGVSNSSAVVEVTPSTDLLNEQTTTEVVTAEESEVDSDVDADAADTELTFIDVDSVNESPEEN